MEDFTRFVIYPHVSHMIWDKRVFKLKPAVVAELKASFRKVGQLQPGVVIPPIEEGGPHKLNIGRHRYQAVKELYAEDPDYIHQFLGKPVPRGTFPAIDIQNVPPEILLNMEISENVHRMDLDWKERAEALATLHEFEQRLFEEKKAKGEVPENAVYTISATAKKLAGATGGSPRSMENKISQSLILAKQLDDPDIASAESPKAAFNRLRGKLTAEARTLQMGDIPEGESPHLLYEQDCRLLMPIMEAGQIDFILGDPPYGIGADTYDNMKEHRYNDTWENAVTVYTSICVEGFRLARERANMVLFCAPERWHDVRDIAEAAGWVSWPRPLIWAKSNEGMRPWGQQGFAYTYECMYFGTKGQKGLISTSNDIFAYYKPKSSEREHAAAKPVELYARLMELSCLPGDTVLDPCVGSGTSFKAGFIQNVRVIGIEDNEQTAKIARKNLHWKGEPDTPPARVEPEPQYKRSLADIL